jgi:hypothetical protein
VSEIHDKQGFNNLLARIDQVGKQGPGKATTDDAGKIIADIKAWGPSPAEREKLVKHLRRSLDGFAPVAAAELGAVAKSLSAEPAKTQADRPGFSNLLEEIDRVAKQAHGKGTTDDAAKIVSEIQAWWPLEAHGKDVSPDQKSENLRIAARIERHLGAFSKDAAAQLQAAANTLKATPPHPGAPKVAPTRDLVHIVEAIGEKVFGHHTPAAAAAAPPPPPPAPPLRGGMAPRPIDSQIVSSLPTLERPSPLAQFQPINNLLLPPQHKVILNWTLSTSTNVTGEKIHFGTKEGGPYTQTIPLGASVANYTITGLAPAAYYFVVTAVAGTVESADSNEAAVVVP